MCVERKSWTLESNFLPTCGFIFTLHSVLVKFYTFLLSPIIFISWQEMYLIGGKGIKRISNCLGIMELS